VNPRLVGMALVLIGFLLLALGEVRLQLGLSDYSSATAPQSCDFLHSEILCPSVTIDEAEIAIAISALVLDEGVAVFVVGFQPLRRNATTRRATPE
jgi:hypothetical protein